MTLTFIGQTGPNLGCWAKSQLHLWSLPNLNCLSVEITLGEYLCWSAHKRVSSASPHLTGRKTTPEQRGKSLKVTQ